MTKMAAPRDFICSDLPERDYFRSASKERTRKLGQYFTPFPVARFMAEWVNQAASLQRVLDPAVGLGIFFRALLDVNPKYSGSFVGFDVDAAMLARLRDLLPGSAAQRLSLSDSDFLFTANDHKFDGVLCNPPYLRYKAIHEREQLLRQTERLCGIALSPSTNLYAFFILRCAQALAPGGRAAILVPAEFLYSGFGVPVKAFLLSSGMLRHLIIFDQVDSLFEDAITTSCILLLAHEKNKQPVSFITIRSPSDLASLSRDISCLNESPVPLAVISPSEISPEDKWSRYFYDPTSSSEFHHLVPFSQIGRVMRGIACGDNHFFTFNREKITRSDIPSSFFLPCLTRSAQAAQTFFRWEDFDQLAEAGKPVFLLDAIQNPDHPAVKAYLQHGEGNGSHLRFLTRSRSPWYRLESRPPAPILATTFHRKELRFVRNEAGVRNLTCFHSIYLRPGLETKADLLMAYLLTPLAHSLIRRNRRMYGDGLIKYEPNDLNSALIADLIKLPEELERVILEAYTQYRCSYLAHQPDDRLILQLETLFRDWMQANEDRRSS
jgi:adenine-specific DNA-methyltransferase